MSEPRRKPMRFLIESFTPDWSVHPGETLRELLDELGWTQKDLAEMCGVSQKHVSEIVNGKAGIGPSFALALERETLVAAEFWVRMQAVHEVAAARRAAVAEVVG